MITFRQNAFLLSVGVASFFTAVTTGCGSSPLPKGPSGSGTSSHVQGQVVSGRQPIANAQILLYAAGTNEAKTGPQNLFGSTQVNTDQNGDFSLPSDFSCPSSAVQTYIVARHGNPGLTPAVSNPALVLLAPLGDCQNIGSSFITINEVTTASSAWALSPFLGPDATVTSSATNTTGLRNAFLTAMNLVDVATGLSPGTGLPAGAAIETAKLYALSNALTSCVESDGTKGCGPLFAASSIDEAQPTNTLDAALNIVRNPGANVQGIFSVATLKSPYQPALTTAPHDWTFSITFKGGGLDQPGNIAVDSNGNVWTPNYFNHVLSGFSSVGEPLSATGFAATGLAQSFGIAIDANDDVWVANENSVTGAGNAGLGSVSRFSNQGTELSGFGYTGGGVFYPQGLAADATGKVWVADYGDSSATLLSSSGGAISGANGFGPSELPFTSAVAVDQNHNAWFTVQGGVAKVTTSGNVTKFSCCDDPEGVAIDQNGSVWLADYGGARVIKMSASGAIETSLESPDSYSAAQGIAVDGIGRVFTANFRGNSIEELGDAPVRIVSPSYGFGLDAALNEPLGIALDASGNLWVSNTGGNTITQFVGLVSPVHTPMLGPPTAP